MDERVKNLVGQVLDREFRKTWSTMDYDDLLKFAHSFATALEADRATNKPNDYFEFNPLDHGVTFNYNYDHYQTTPYGDRIITGPPSGGGGDAKVVMELAEAIKAVAQQLEDERAKTPPTTPPSLIKI